MTNGVTINGQDFTDYAGFNKEYMATYDKVTNEVKIWKFNGYKYGDLSDSLTVSHTVQITEKTPGYVTTQFLQKILNEWIIEKNREDIINKLLDE